MFRLRGSTQRGGKKSKKKSKEKSESYTNKEIRRESVGSERRRYEVLESENRSFPKQKPTRIEPRTWKELK